MGVQKLLNPDFIGYELIQKLQEAKPNLRSRLGYVFNNLTRILKPDFGVTVHYISDNAGYPDTAKIEIKKRLADINLILSPLSGHFAPKTYYHDIPSQDWRAGAFDLAQISRDAVCGVGNIVFLNCAPRRKQRGIKQDNEGEGVYIGMLRNGTIIAAVSEDSFCLFRDLIEKGDLEIYLANVQIKGSQFRSRDFFPWLSQIIATNLQRSNRGWRANMDVAGRRAYLEKLNFVKTNHILTSDDITDFKQNPCVLRADCHGNLKLSLREIDIKEQQIPLNTPLRIRVGDHTHTAMLKQGMFDPAQKIDLGLAFGSSGNWDDSEEGRFLELAILGKSLRDELGIDDHTLKEGVEIDIIGLAADHNAPAQDPKVINNP